MRPQLITSQMIQNVKYNITRKKIYIKKNNNLYANIGTFLLIGVFFYYLYYRYTNKNEIIQKKKQLKKAFSDTLYNYYNQIKRQELMEVLNSNTKENIFNEYKIKTPGLINMNNKEWVKNPLKY